MKKRDKKKRSASAGPAESIIPDSPSLVRRHMRIGWWSLLVFLSVGIVLESMHGFKVQWYVGEDNSTRRLMFTLGHAHGTLLSLVHLAYAGAMHILKMPPRAARSWCLSVATILMPVGFFAGGITVYDGDPGLGILFVPIGAALLFAAVLFTAISVETS